MINRNKTGFAADLKSAEDLSIIRQLIGRADVLTHNFRPGVMESVGLDYDGVQWINPRIVYGEISGYGKEGPGSGPAGTGPAPAIHERLAYTTGNEEDNPVPFGLSIADSLCGAQLVQGILGALIRRQRTSGGVDRDQPDGIPAGFSI